MFRGDMDQAQALLEQSVAKDPSAPLALGELGNLYLFRQQYELAIPVFERLLAANPEDSQSHLKLAQALRKLGRPADRGRVEEHERKYKELKQQSGEKPPSKTPKPG
jgi:Flp pilus assembly protein TadD